MGDDRHPSRAPLGPQLVAGWERLARLAQAQDAALAQGRWQEARDLAQEAQDLAASLPYLPPEAEPEARKAQALLVAVAARASATLDEVGAELRALGRRRQAARAYLAASSSPAPGGSRSTAPEAGR